MTAQVLAQILDGTRVAKALNAYVLAEAEKLASTNPEMPTPHLVVILVGAHPASKAYVGRKIKAAKTAGIRSTLIELPDTVSETELLGQVEQLNAHADVHAILVQLPLPKAIDANLVLDTIQSSKDVDGFHPETMGRLLLGLKPVSLPCTPAGMMTLLQAYNLPIAGKHAVMVGRSNIVGKPMSLLLTQADATVTLCHSRTKNLAEIVKQADIVVAAVGRVNTITADMVKPGAVILDVGMNRTNDGKLVGDVDFEGVSQVAGYITPVPGGVGPMTVASLMLNTLRLTQASNGLPLSPVPQLGQALTSP